MKHNFQTNSEVFLYFIKSDFKEILLRLCNKILNESENSLINLRNDSELLEVEKYLWTKDKENFLPHCIFNENISELDNLILFKGSYEKMQKLSRFKKLIISPSVKSLTTTATNSPFRKTPIKRNFKNSQEKII